MGIQQLQLFLRVLHGCAKFAWFCLFDSTLDFGIEFALKSKDFPEINCCFVLPRSL